MTAPDPTPCAAPGDLVTAADVARWLREWRSTATDNELIDAVDWERGYDVHDLRSAHNLAQELASRDLDERLDRERRQACRRGALAMFREAIMWRAAERESCRGETWAAVCRERRKRRIGRALAFRAAARQP